MASRTRSNPRKRNEHAMKKKLQIAGGAAVGLLGGSILLLMLFFDGNQFRPQLEQTMGAALGRNVTLGRITVAPFSGGIAVQDLSVADDAAFSAEPFVTAKAVTV